MHGLSSQHNEKYNSIVIKPLGFLLPAAAAAGYQSPGSHSENIFAALAELISLHTPLLLLTTQTQVINY